ncbi:MAG: YebC/PmpR family DNA-binding transcriptional regulator [Patescibacteria group bacterium]
MAGHSKWAKIHRGKAIEDAKRGAVFTKLGNNIAIAARAGADPDTNFTLRLAIDKAKASNMPGTNIQKAIDRGSGKLGGEQIQEVLYEGYGPGGTAILIECATDNINRTYPEVRLAFTKHGGSIAEKGSVAFLFDHKGMIIVKETGEELLLDALDVGAEDVLEDEGETTIYTEAKKLAEVRDAIKEKYTVTEAELTYVPKDIITITDESTIGKITRLLDKIEENDDVVKTHVNFDVEA